MPKVTKFPAKKGEQNIDALVTEYATLRAQDKTITARMKVLAEEIKGYAQIHGEKDDKGSYYLDNGAFQFGSQAKKSVTLHTEKALELLKSKGLTDAIQTVEVVDESAVERYLSEGTLTMEELESITTTKVSYSIDVKQKEAMPVVEETTVALAASRKPTKPKLSARKGR